jgi:TPR repeat protein
MFAMFARASLAAVTFVLAIACAPACASVEDGEAAFLKGDFKTAQARLSEVALAEHPVALYYLGIMHIRGLGVPRDERKGLAMVQRAAAADERRALTLLGAMHFSGGIAPRDHTRALALFRRAAEREDAAAQHWLGTFYQGGLADLGKDEPVAFQWFEKAARQEFAPAMYQVGRAIDRGLGVEKNERTAVDWYKRCAEKRESNCLMALGSAYLTGRGGLLRDRDEGLKLVRTAALQKNAAAQVMLARIYAEGLGVPVDYVLGYMWLNLARSNSADKQIEQRLEELAKKMTPEQVADAQRRSREMTSGAQLAKALETLRPKPAARSYGTGFHVNGAGHVVTNAHVVENCARVLVQPGGAEASVLGKDVRNDLAVLASAAPSETYASLRGGRNVRPGDEVLIVGYPLKDVLSSGAVLTTGSVSALGGPANDTSKLQISAPVQSGNSGGPLLDHAGLVTGVVQSKLNALRVAAATGDIPQNVNFAINAATLTGFLDASNVAYRTVVPDERAVPARDIFDLARQYTVLIECVR